MDKSLILNKIKEHYAIVRDADFARFLGIKPQTLASWHTRNTFDIELLYSKCVDIDANWLLSGEGNMLKNNLSITTQEVPSFRKTIDPVHELQRVPLFRLEATMGIVPLLNNNGIDPDYIVDYISIPDLAKCDGAIYATGDSMYPLLKSGDIVAYKIISPENIFFGEMYLLSVILDEDTSYKTIKWVQKSELGNEYIKLVSHNQHHDPKDIKISQIAAIGMIRASIRLHN